MFISLNNQLMFIFLNNQLVQSNKNPDILPLRGVQLSGSIWSACSSSSWNMTRAGSRMHPGVGRICWTRCTLAFRAFQTLLRSWHVSLKGPLPTEKIQLVACQTSWKSGVGLATSWKACWSQGCMDLASTSTCQAPVTACVVRAWDYGSTCWQVSVSIVSFGWGLHVRHLLFCADVSPNVNHQMTTWEIKPVNLCRWAAHICLRRLWSFC